MWPAAFTLVVSLLSALGACTGDASRMAADQPRAHDMKVLKVSTLRHRIIATLMLTETPNGVKTDIFKFVNGYSTAAKTSRSFLHGAMNVGTFGIWDVFDKPIESTFQGEGVRVKVEYDANDRVKYVKRFQ